MFGFRKSPVNVKLDSATERYLELQAELKRLEIEVKNKEQDLEHEKKRKAMAMEEEQHKSRLLLASKTAEFDREKQVWQEDKAKMIKNHIEEMEKFKKDREDHYKTKHENDVAILKLDSEQRIRQVDLDYSRKELVHDKALRELELKHTKELSDVERKIQEQYHVKLDTALTDLHSKGNLTTNFVKDLALSLLPQAPEIRKQINETKVFTGTTVDQ